MLNEALQESKYNDRLSAQAEQITGQTIYEIIEWVIVFEVNHPITKAGKRRSQWVRNEYGNGAMC